MTVCAGADRSIPSVRQLMVNVLQNHTNLDRPKHCPPLEPYRYLDLNLDRVGVCATANLALYVRLQRCSTATSAGSKVRSLHSHPGGGTGLVRGARGNQNRKEETRSKSQIRTGTGSAVR